MAKAAGRLLRYRRLVIRQAVQMKSRVSGLLMETGESYNKLRLHRMGYFAQLLQDAGISTGWVHRR